VKTLKLRSVGALRILDFDIETRKVGFFQAGKFSPDGCEPTAIAASWVGEKKVSAWLQPELSVPEMLAEFVRLYDQADLVTGHYVRKFDLPILNGALLEHGLPLLSEKRVCDTKCDLVTKGGLSSSQENLGAMLKLADSKYHMNDHRWRASTRLDPAGIEEARKRAVSDVRQHKQLRLALLAAGALRPPREWRP
jgi:DNA polymerase elongation subunit (family B)